MQGFPPAPPGQATLANWRNPPFNKWAFHHVRELLPTADIANDHGPLTEAELRAVVLAYPYALGDPECPAQPVDCLTHVRVDEDGDDGGLWDRPVPLHGWPV